MDIRIAHAMVRFGLGGRLGEPPPTDPAAWLADQLHRPPPPPPIGPSTADGLSALAMDRDERKGLVDKAAGQPSRVRNLFRDEMSSLLTLATVTDAPFRERLVWFWANHFTVSLRRGEIAAVAGAYLRDVIRPHVTGRFGNMLQAAVHHPAMIMYLDNGASIGPNSLAGLRQHKGLNENLARECLELHTVSPAAGYTQADVTEFAKVLTGWQVERAHPPLGARFNPNAHEPGPKFVMGQTFDAGEQGSRDALDFLAAHPATHRHLATKLVRHFVADDPPPAAIRRIEGVLRDTRGDLGAASLALTQLPDAWRPMTKLRTPQDYILAVMRAAPVAPEIPPDKRPDLQAILNGLGQGMFNAPFPIGYPDTATEWAGPEAILRRIDWAYGFAARTELPDPALVADAIAGPLLGASTANDVRRAGSRREAMTLLLASPEVLRR